MSGKAITTDEEARAYVEALIEQAGGYEAYAGSDRRHKELFRKLLREKASLRQKYPDKFVAMAPGDVLVVGDTLEEIIRSLREKGVPRGEAVIDFLDVNSGSLAV